MVEIELTDIKEHNAEKRRPVSAIFLLKRALKKLEEERNGKVLNPRVIIKRDERWKTQLERVEGKNLPELLDYVYNGTFFFWNSPEIIQEYYGSLKRNFKLFFKTFISGYCQDLIGKARTSKNITVYYIGDGTSGSGEYSDKVINFINAIGPALEDIGIMRGENIMTDLKTSFDQEYTGVKEAYSRPIDTN